MYFLKLYFAGEAQLHLPPLTACHCHITGNRGFNKVIYLTGDFSVIDSTSKKMRKLVIDGLEL